MIKSLSIWTDVVLCNVNYKVLYFFAELITLWQVWHFISEIWFQIKDNVFFIWGWSFIIVLRPPQGLPHSFCNQISELADASMTLQVMNSVLMVHQDLFFLFSFSHCLVIPILSNKSMGYHKFLFVNLF